MNSHPHIGHAFEFIIGDAISKFYKSNGTDVHFNVGVDENGLKVFTKSQEFGISPQEHVENLTVDWKKFCERFQIEYDSFYRTSTEDHHKKVQDVWTILYNKGDIYKKKYSGRYCLGCESYKLDKDLQDDRCSDHPTTELTKIEEDNYFFRLSKYTTKLSEWIRSNPEFLFPSNKINELTRLIDEYGDISISRTKENCPWGVEVPNDTSQTIYVWFDALLNYVFAAGYKTDNFNWDNVIQICGPDNLRFQGVIFQSFLEALDIKKTDSLIVHGTILDANGQKISKTLGNVIDPIGQLDKFGIYPVRYYSLAGLSTYGNSSWDEQELINLWNGNIVNDWGNIVSRVLHLIDIKSCNITDVSTEFTDKVDDLNLSVIDTWNKFQVKDALQKTNVIVKLGNKYINDEAPWKKDNCDQILSELYHLLKVVNKLYIPVFGFDKFNEIENILNQKKKVILFDRI